MRDLDLGMCIYACHRMSPPRIPPCDPILQRLSSNLCSWSALPESDCLEIANVAKSPHLGGRLMAAPERCRCCNICRSNGRKSCHTGPSFLPSPQQPCQQRNGLKSGLYRGCPVSSWWRTSLSSVALKRGHSSPPSFLPSGYWKLFDLKRLCCRCISAVGGLGYLQ